MPKWVEIVGAIIGISGIIGGALWVADIEWRIRSLETQATARAVVPTVANQDGQIVVADPIATACAEVSRKLIEATEPVGFGVQIEAYKEQLALLGCSDR